MLLSDRIKQFALVCQEESFSELDASFGPLPGRCQLFVLALEMVPMEDFLPSQSRGSRGRPLAHRTSIAKAFLARMIFQIPTTTALRERLLIDRILWSLCGWSRGCDAPGASTLSRVFQEFAESELPPRIHEALIRSCYENEVVGHILRDSTTMEAREAAVKKEENEGEEKAPKGPPMLERQREMADALPKECSVGCKRNARGRRQSWVGWKIPVDVADGGVPISCIGTSASVHDSQVAIPLAEMTADRVLAVLYALMDSACDAKQMHAHTEELGQVSITDSHPRRNGKAARDQENKARRAAGFTPPERIRYRERSTVERAFARLKDEFGFQNLRVRGYQKMMCHMMFGVLALTVDSLLRLAA